MKSCSGNLNIFEYIFVKNQQNLAQCGSSLDTCQKNAKTGEAKKLHTTKNKFATFANLREKCVNAWIKPIDWLVFCYTKKLQTKWNKLHSKGIT